MKRNSIKFIDNLGLLISGTATAFSGLLIQIKYHMGHHGAIAISDKVFGVNYPGWSTIHKISIVVLTLLMIYHIYQHWNWYKVVIKKRLITKNHQVLILSLLFVFVAITGLAPWLIDLLNGGEIYRKVFIEIHDKLTLILVIYLILHVVKRMRWFFYIFEKK